MRVIYDFETGGFTGTHAIPIQIGFARGTEKAQNTYFDVKLFPDLESSPDELKFFGSADEFFANTKTKDASAVTGLTAASLAAVPDADLLSSGADVQKFLQDNFEKLERIGYNSDQFDIKQMAKLSIAADLNVARDAGNKDEVKRLFDLYKKVVANNDSKFAGEYVREKFGGKDVDVFTRYSQVMFGIDRPTDRSGHKLTDVHKRLFPGKYTDEYYNAAHDGAFDVDITTEIHDELTELEGRIKSGELTENDKLLRNQYDQFGKSVTKIKDETGGAVKSVKKIFSETSGVKKAGIIAGAVATAGVVGFGISKFNQRKYEEEQMKLAAVDDIINGDQGSYL